MKIQSKNKAFTLIELLITIAIVGILSAITAVSFINPPKLARDATRKSDIKQYQTLLENYANKNSGLYVDTLGTVNPSSICATLGSTNCPNDPVAGQQYYLNSTTTSYVVWARLEKPVQYFIVCSDGKVGLSATAPSSSSCPI